MTTIPSGYPVCEHEDCPQAATCLHQTAYQELQKQEEYLHLINPNRCTTDGTCKYYRDNTPVTYARGFTNFQKKMFPGQYKKFMSILIGTFSRNPYFERRRGDTPLSPKEQAVILNALEQAGVGTNGSPSIEDFKFDSYEECINWYD